MPPLQTILPPSLGHSVQEWQPSTFYDNGAVVVYEAALYRSTGPHLSGESATPSKTLAQWLPLSVSVFPAESNPPSQYHKPTYADMGVQTDISFPNWVGNSWPMPGPFASHPLAFPWLPPPLFPPSLPISQPLPPPPPAPPPQFSAQNPQSAPLPMHIHSPMPLHLPMRLPPSLESVLVPISDPFDTRYRAARAAERAQQSLISFRAEVLGERVVRSHGCGEWAYGGSRQRSMEDDREAAWRECGMHGPEAWLRSARARRAAYAVPGAVRPPVRWVLVEEGQRIPEDALQTGMEATGEPLFSTRVWWKGGLHLGKAASHIFNNASISWDSQEHNTPTFEILCGSPAYVQWLEIPHGSRASPEQLHNFEAVEGGREAHGTFILVSQGEYGLGAASGLHPGKASVGDDHACIGYGGGEVWIRPFRVLVYSRETMG